MVMQRRAFLLLMSTTSAAAAGPIRNPGRIDQYHLTAEDRRSLVWHAARGAVRHDELGLSPQDAAESTDVLIGARMLNEGGGGVTRSGWLALAGIKNESKVQ